MDLQVVARGEREHLDQPRRILGEPVVARDRQPPAVEREAVEPPRAALDPRQREAAVLLGQLLVELGEEQPGQVADDLGVEEVELHEALDRRLARPVGVAHRRGDRLLHVEPEPLLGASGGEVEVAPHRPEEALGALEAAEFGGGEQPLVDQVGGALDPERILADPVERVEIAQAALAVLDVGFDDIAAVAHAAVALVALGELGGDIVARASGDDLAAEAARSPRRPAPRRPRSSAPRASRCGSSCRSRARLTTSSIVRTDWPIFSFRSHSR